MPNKPSTTLSAPATPAAEATAVVTTATPAPIDPIVTRSGQPLTTSSSLEDILNADPLAVATPAGPPSVDAEAGVSVASLGETPSETPPADAAPPTEAPPDTPPAEAPPETPPEPVTPPVDEAHLIERLIDEKRGLLRLKGQQASEKRELRDQIDQLTQTVQALQERLTSPGAPPSASKLSDEELAARFLEKPSQFLLTPEQAREIARNETMNLLVQHTQEWQQANAEEQAAVAPEVAKDLFCTRHGIETDFDSWLATDDGKAVNDIVFKDPSRRRALEGFVDDGNIQEIANVLTKAYEARNLGKRAAAARIAQNGERARIEAGKPASAPSPPAVPPSNLLRAKGLYDQWDDQDLRNFLAGAEPYEVER